MEQMYDRDGLHMVRLELAEKEKSEYVEERRLNSRLSAKARTMAKAESCYICGKTCTSFCDSHSVPRFVLERIAEKGKVYSPLQNERSILGRDYGVSNAGRFNLICRECDSRVFRDYENPLTYGSAISHNVLAQIAMKNYLHLISKKKEDLAFFEAAEEEFSHNKLFWEERKHIAQLDLSVYIEAYKKAKKASEKTFDDTYYLCFYKLLDYVVPVAGQDAITLIADFDDHVINDIYFLDKSYKTEDIHIAVFPLQTSSALIMFVDSSNKRYRNFYRKLRRLEEQDQLSTLNYIIFSYSENFYVTASARDVISSNPRFFDICEKTTDYTGDLTPMSLLSFEDPLKRAVEEFSLSKKNDIPNLLDRRYAVD